MARSNFHEMLEIKRTHAIVALILAQPIKMALKFAHSLDVVRASIHKGRLLAGHIMVSWFLCSVLALINRQRYQVE